MTPRAGSMLGTGRVIVGERTAFFEFLRVEATADRGGTHRHAPRRRGGRVEGAEGGRARAAETRLERAP